MKMVQWGGWYRTLGITEAALAGRGFKENAAAEEEFEATMGVPSGEDLTRRLRHKRRL